MKLKYSSYFGVFLVLFISPGLNVQAITDYSPLIKQYNANKYELVIQVLKNISPADNLPKLYLLYKSYYNLNDFEQALDILTLLEKEPKEGFEELIEYEKIKLFMKLKDIDGLLRYLGNRNSEMITPLLIPEMKNFIVHHYGKSSDRDLLRRVLKKLIFNEEEFRKSAGILKLYIRLNEKGSHEEEEAMVILWESIDITRLQKKYRKIAKKIKKNIVFYDRAVLKHFKRQYKLGNLSYCLKNIPLFLPYLKNADKSIFIQTRDIYFDSLMRRRYYSRALRVLRSTKNQSFFQLTPKDIKSYEFEILLKKRKGDQALEVLNVLRELIDEKQYHRNLVLLGGFFFWKGEFKKSENILSFVKQELFDRDAQAEIKWKLFRIYLELGEEKKADAILKWSQNYDFAHPEDEAKYCYWRQKINGSRLADEPDCYQKNPWTYYGLKTYISGNVAKTDLKSNGRKGALFPQTDIRQRQLAEVIDMLYSLNEDNLASFLVEKEYLDSDEHPFLLQIADLLKKNKQYYILQKLLKNRFQEELKDDFNKNINLLTYFYPLAFQESVKNYANKYKVPEKLVFAIMREESTFRPSVKSGAGAVGLLQLMPKTAKYVGRKIGLKVKTRNLVHPETNLRLGIKYLEGLLKRYDGNLYYTLAAYNGGPSNVRKWKR
ncbi:MAG: lytic transglycosylase domain-containing protein, partial [Deltaproteobacteria bacterium]|nr:lytic transglycosylase domain-containing protein [Deltaproteobacteria bacterium]